MDRYDGMVLVGLGMVGWGLYLVYAPLALIVPGAVVLAVGVLGAMRGGGDGGGPPAEL